MNITEKEMLMKKTITALMCLSLLALLLTACTPNEPEEPSNKPCSHSYSEGKCVYCNADDPNYITGGGSGGENEDEPGEDDPEIPPIDLGGEGELPFVPAN